MSYTIQHGSVFDVLPTMPPASVHCCVTSPPYWGLRDYGVEGQLGLERTPDEYVSRMVEVFREVWRVLRDDGTLWLNLGDSYSGGGGYSPDAPSNQKRIGFNEHARHFESSKRKSVLGLKPKDLIGIPWSVAFALRADGWYLRSDIIWAKSNPMPESVTDRPTKAHEYVFLLSKSERYRYDADAIREPHLTASNFRNPSKEAYGTVARLTPLGSGEREFYHTNGRNKRTVWTLATLPTPDAHFATFPIELPELCIKAGCPEGGIVLDPFAGSGTTGLAAIKNGRQFIGIELNPEYITIAHNRLDRHYSLFAERSKTANEETETTGASLL